MSSQVQAKLEELQAKLDELQAELGGLTRKNRGLSIASACAEAKAWALEGECAGHLKTIARLRGLIDRQDEELGRLRTLHRGCYPTPAPAEHQRLYV